MSERFLEGFIVDPKALAALIGTPKLAAKTIRKKLGRKPVLVDVDLTLGDGERADGKLVVDAALDALAKGKPGRGADAYAMVRITSLVLHAYATRLGTAELVPHIESDSFGLMNPVFKALGMPTLAKDYGTTLLAWPFAKPRAVDWPIVMVADANLAAWQRELAADWAAKLPALPDKVFTSKSYGLDRNVEYTRADLAPFLAKLKMWVGKAAKQKGQALVLILDGDQ